jgi:hypothetical protein
MKGDDDEQPARRSAASGLLALVAFDRSRGSRRRGENTYRVI